MGGYDQMARREDCGGSSLSFLEYMLSLTQAIDSSHEERERWSRLQRHLAWEVIRRAVARDLGRWLLLGGVPSDGG